MLWLSLERKVWVVQDGGRAWVVRLCGPKAQWCKTARWRKLVIGVDQHSVRAFSQWTEMIYINITAWLPVSPDWDWFKGGVAGTVGDAPFHSLEIVLPFWLMWLMPPSLPQFGAYAFSLHQKIFHGWLKVLPTPSPRTFTKVGPTVLQRIF